MPHEAAFEPPPLHHHHHHQLQVRQLAHLLSAPLLQQASRAEAAAAGQFAGGCESFDQLGTQLVQFSSERCTINNKQYAQRVVEIIIKKFNVVLNSSIS